MRSPRLTAPIRKKESDPMAIVRPTVFSVILAGLVLATPTLHAQEVEGDPTSGERIFRQCSGCHSVVDGQNRVGPHLWGIIGRPAASAEGFRYSDALAESEIAWDAESLAAYLTDPRGEIPGTRKSFVLRDAGDAADVIAFLATLTE